LALLGLGVVAGVGWERSGCGSWKIAWGESSPRRGLQAAPIR